MARPLTKKDKNGVLYVRPASVESVIDALAGKDLDSIKGRAEIRSPNSSQYVPSESLVFVIRDAWRRGDQKTMEALFPFLLNRCEARLKAKIPREEFADAEEVRENILNEFALLFAEDLTDPRCRLDFFECRFNAAFRTF